MPLCRMSPRPADRPPTGWIVGLVCLAALAAGCGQDDVARLRAGTDAPDGKSGLAVAASLCRKVGTESGRRIGAGDVFRIAEKSYVQALVDFTGVRTDHVYAVHLVWIRPDGGELFRRYAEVETAAADSGYASTIRWRKAEDLHYLSESVVTTDEPSFTLDSRLNISTDRDRTPGQYVLRVYLHRELLLERTFLVEPEA